MAATNTRCHVSDLGRSLAIPPFRYRRMSPPIRCLVAASAIALLAACGADTTERADVATVTTDSAGVRMRALSAADQPYDGELEEVARLAPRDSGAGAFGAVYAGNVATNGVDRIYIFNQDESSIAVFDDTGAPRATFGRRGGGPGEVGTGTDLSVEPDGALSVFDYARDAYVRFDSAGAALPLRRLPSDSIGAPDASGRALPDGFLFATRRMGTDSLTRALRLLTDTDTTTLVTQTIAVTKEMAFGTCPVRLFGIPPYFATEFAYDAAPGGVAVLRDRTWRVEWYHGGRLAEVWTRPGPERASSLDALAREAGEGLTIRFNNESCTTPLAEAAEARGMVPTIPALRRIAVAPDGTLWAERWEPAKDMQRVDVIDPDGRYRGTISGRGAPLGFLRGGRVLYADTDSVTEVQSLVVWRVAGAGW